MPLDRLGISVCAIGGINFAPFVKLLGPSGVAIPHVILTDLDPMEGGRPLARRRIETLLGLVRPGRDYAAMEDAEIFRRGERRGMFVNTNTLETELFAAGLAGRMGRILRSELSLAQATRDRIDGWVADPATVDTERLLDLIERVGKGRFAQRLAGRATAATCSAYIRAGLEFMRNAVA